MRDGKAERQNELISFRLGTTLFSDIHVMFNTLESSHKAFVRSFSAHVHVLEFTESQSQSQVTLTL